MLHHAIARTACPLQLVSAAACMTLLLAILAPQAHAQLAETPSGGAARSSGGSERDGEPMAWFGVGVKAGVGYVGGSEHTLRYDTRSEQFSADSRLGFRLGLPINVGGSGLGLVVEPYLTVDQHVKSYGAYAGPTLNLQIARPVYLGVGAGVEAAYLVASYLDHGVDLGARIPFMLTVYLADDLAVHADVGIGYMASGYAYEERASGAVSELDFGSAFAWDASVGLRFP